MTGSGQLDIFDLHVPAAAPAGHAWWPYAVAAVSLAIAAVVIARAWLASRRRASSPEVRALAALEAARAPMTRGDAPAFSAQVSAAVRDYVELAFGVRAPRRTTEELLADLMRDASPVAAHREALGAFLVYCDLAKYARFALTAEQMAGMLASAEAFVRATAAAPATAAPATAAVPAASASHPAAQGGAS